MQEPAPVVLITRPEAAARRFAAQVEALGLRHVIAPLLRIVGVPHDGAAVRDATGLVFTSENGVRFAGPGRGRPAWCVGPRTAEQARKAGYDVREGPGDAARLIPLIDDLGPGWLHPHGAHVAARLPAPGMVVYDQLPLPPSPEALALLQGTAPVILPLFSPRSARLAAEAARGSPGAPLRIVPISAAAEAAWRAAWPEGPVRCVVADQPDAESILRAIRAVTDTEREPFSAG
ncbi:uroporphyrinogen-III synthase [Paracoccus sp. MC1862]|uniref:uroporphyrinogen-III synthase n=1 Tax=Paracoccus sp. MC1862 TaxID=2760307 RepID=UPI001601907B|nr:uroporphyrinogen-III synthase [Paracoccus sp. MC1862]MBB1497425.1 uroporphyrinogen-III synthase [Paracoccus sp. MC1862]QQO45911.1 uroporphyrinogen-III synthase [Paracoccus sp. MC1862]